MANHQEIDAYCFMSGARLSIFSENGHVNCAVFLTSAVSVLYFAVKFSSHRIVNITVRALVHRMDSDSLGVSNFIKMHQLLKTLHLYFNSGPKIPEALTLPGNTVMILLTCSKICTRVMFEFKLESLIQSEYL